MANDKRREVDSPELERLDYAGASDRARELRADAEHYLETARAELDGPEEGNVPAAAAARAAAALGLALVCSVLEVSARLELLELDAELAREEASE